MSSKDLRPSSAQSRTAWGDYGSGGHARPDNQFDFGPRDDPDLPSAMENDIYVEKENQRNEVSTTTPKKSTGCWSCFTSGIRCEYIL